MENTLPHKCKGISFQGIACIPSAVQDPDLWFRTKAAGDQGSIQVLLCGWGTESPRGPHMGSGFTSHPSGALPWARAGGPPI